MKQFVIFCSILALSYGAPSNRIVGGEDAEPGQFKYIASLRYASSNSHFCGATIISPRTLVTAAHCRVTSPQGIVAVVGTTRQSDDTAPRHRLNAFINHPDYDSSSITNDIAVIILDTPIEFNDLVQPASLPTSSWAAGDEPTASGWGLTSYPGSVPNQLQWFQTTIISHEQCRPYSRILTGKICTFERKGEGVCSGDSGGPLVNDNNELVGTTSAAFLCALGLPDFFTDVFYFKDWILQNAQM